SVISAAAHVLAVILLILAAYVAIKLGFGNEYKPVPVTAVEIAPGGAEGPNKGPGAAGNALPEEASNTPPAEAQKPVALQQLPDPTDPKFDPVIDLPKIEDPNASPRVNEAVQQMENLDKDIRQKLFNAGSKGGSGGGGRPGDQGTGGVAGSGTGSQKG